MKLAVLLDSTTTQPDLVVRQMLRAMATREQESAIVVQRIPGGAIGGIGRPGEVRDRLPITQDDAGNVALCGGLPLLLDGNSAPTDALLDNAEACEGWSGAFIAIRLDAAAECLAVTSDVLGMQPFYECKAGRRFAFASEVKGVLAAVDGYQPSVQGWSGLLLFGHPLGDNTVARDVRRFPNATVATFHLRQGTDVTCARRSYWRFPEPPRKWTSLAESTETLLPLLRRETRVACAGFPQSTILLSGGFDSRLMLALAANEDVSLRLLVLKHPDELADMESRFAAAVAERFGMPVDVADPDTDFFSTDTFRWFVERNEFTSTSLYLFIATIASIVSPSLGSAWDGLALDPSLKFTKTNESLSGYFAHMRSHRCTDYLRAARLVFDKDWADALAESLDAQCREAVERFRDDHYGAWQFSIENRTRIRIAGNPLQVYDAFVPTITPGLSHEFWEAATRVDPAHRGNMSLYRGILAAADARAMNVPVVSGGTFVRLGPGREALETRARTRAAFESTIRRPKLRRVLEKLGVAPPFEFRRSRFVDEALAAAESLPFVNAAAADRLRRTRHQHHGDDERAREMLFYWFMSQSVFEKRPAH